MGTALTGLEIKDTYTGLIKTTDNGALTGSLKVLTDGLGNDSTLSLSTTAASIAGTLAVTGNATFDTTTLVVDVTNNRIGIGTAAPLTFVSVETSGVQSTVSPIISAQGAGTTYATFSSIRDGAGDQRGLLFQNFTANVGLTEKMRISSDGNVGIGTSSPASILAVSAASPTITLTATTTTATTIGNKNNRLLLLADSTTGGNGGEVVFGTGDTSTGRWAAISGNITANSGTGSAGSIIFATKAAAVDTSLTERVRILNDGGLTFNGDTAQANALDDYEEGAWTMGVSFGGGTTGITYGSNTGRYTKVGRIVTVAGYLSLSSKGSSTGTASLTGLPFSGGTGGVASCFLSLVTYTGTPQFVGLSSESTVRIYQLTEAGAITQLTDTNFSNTSEIYITYTFTV